MDVNLGQLDDLLGLDVHDDQTALEIANAEELVGLLLSLRGARVDRGLRQRDVAERMGLQRQSSIADIERLGSDPRLSTLRRYANAVGIKLKLSIDSDWRIIDRFQDVEGDLADRHIDEDGAQRGLDAYRVALAAG